MIKIVVLFIMMNVCLVTIYSQENCNIYKYKQELVRYQSCLKCKETQPYYQFSKEYQQILDTAIKIDSNYYYPYKAKSVAYLKSGDFITWKKLIDKAVSLNPEKVLGYRASCRYQFFHDYKGCIEDIENLESMVKYDLGEIHNGDYHFKTIKAISYDAIDSTQKAIKILDEHISSENYYPLIYDYLLMGYFYLKDGQYAKALSFFKKQKEMNDIAENEYYMSIVYSKLEEQENATNSLNLSLKLYKNQKRMNDPYSDPYAKIYLFNIQERLEK